MLPSLMMATAADGLDDAGVSMALSQFLSPTDSIRSWLTNALPLVEASAPDETPVSPPAPVSPVVTEAIARKPKTTAAGTAAIAIKGQ